MGSHAVSVHNTIQFNSSSSRFNLKPKSSERAKKDCLKRKTFAFVVFICCVFYTFQCSMYISRFFISFFTHRTIALRCSTSIVVKRWLFLIFFILLLLIIFFCFCVFYSFRRERRKKNVGKNYDEFKWNLFG